MRKQEFGRYPKKWLDNKKIQDAALTLKQNGYYKLP